MDDNEAPLTATPVALDRVVADACSPVLGKPCWNVQHGLNSLLTFEFGDPHLDIRGPMPSKSGSRRFQQIFTRRHVALHGERHLWIYSGDWAVFQGKALRADSKAGRRRIGRALPDLDGQILTKVDVSLDLRHSVFYFDIGGRLETAVSGDDQISDDEQWMLYEPSGLVLTVRADGCYCRDPGDTPPEQQAWRRPALR